MNATALDRTTWVVTGANSGIGLKVTEGLARMGASVIMACRSEARATQAAEGIRAHNPRARVAYRHLDLADLGTIEHFCEGLDHVDGLVNNAGIMAIPRRETADGFEMQLGTNHLGHFALTLQLLDRLHAAPAGRVVHVSSIAHRRARMNFDDLMGIRSYDRWAAYGQSKLANLLFHQALSHRIADTTTRSIACHPGVADTNLPNAMLEGSRVRAAIASRVMRAVSQSPEQGAQPVLMAATDPSLPNGAFVGLDGFREMWGHPRRSHPSAASQDSDTAARLWDVSQRLTGVRT